MLKYCIELRRTEAGGDQARRKVKPGCRFREGIKQKARKDDMENINNVGFFRKLG